MELLGINDSSQMDNATSSKSCKCNWLVSENESNCLLIRSI